MQHIDIYLLGAVGTHELLTQHIHLIHCVDSQQVLTRPPLQNNTDSTVNIAHNLALELGATARMQAQ